MPEPALVISEQSIAEIKYVSDVQAGREPDPCPVCSSTDHPETRHPEETIRSKRAAALTVLARLSDQIPSNLQAIVSVTGWLELDIHLLVDDPGIGADLAADLGLPTKESRIADTEEHLQHYWTGRIDEFDVEIVICEPHPDVTDVTDE